MILRRSIILALGPIGLLARGAFSQTAVTARRVGLLSSGAPFADTSPLLLGLTAGFSKRGYVVGSSLLFERRAAEAHSDRLPQLVDDLKSKAELIITNSSTAARVIKDRSNVPVVDADHAGLGECVPSDERREHQSQAYSSQLRELTTVHFLSLVLAIPLWVQSRRFRDRVTSAYPPIAIDARTFQIDSLVPERDVTR